MMATRNKSTLVFTVLVNLLLIGALCFMAYGNISQLRTDLEADANRFLSEISSLGAERLKIRIDDDLRTLESFASTMGIRSDFNLQAELPFLEAILGPNDQFLHMGFLLPDSTAYTTDGFAGRVPMRDYAQQAFEGTPAVSQPFEDVITGEVVNAYGVPVYEADGTIIAVLFAGVRNTLFQEILADAAFDNESRSAIVTGNGTYVVDFPGESLAGPNLGTGILPYLPEDSRASMLLDFHEQQSGIMKMTFNELPYYFYYTPIGINDWMMVSAVPEQVVSGNASNILRFAVTVWIVVAMIVVLLLLGINLLQSVRMREYRKLAFADSLTGLPNWASFAQNAEHLLRSAKPGEYALLSFDIDKFHVYTDTFGDVAAHNFLKHVASVMHNDTESSELCARYVDDRFVLLLRYIGEPELCARIRRLADSFAQGAPFYDFSFSFGVVVLEDLSLSISSQYECADHAQTMIKEKRDILYQFYDEDIKKHVEMENQLEKDMKEALRTHQFEVFYQPKYSVSGNHIVGAEALVRWRHPTYGLLSPGVFLPLFERNGFILQLDLYVFSELCKTLRSWQQEGLDCPHMSFNLSRLHLTDSRIVSVIEQITTTHSVSPHDIEIEITENVFMESGEKTASILDAFHHAGFSIAMDDFGKGYSSLGFLQNLRVDVIKLDGSFFEHVIESERSQIILLKVVQMAKQLSVSIVAEGIETQAQIDVILELGCDIVQGYFFARPMPSPEYKNLLEEQAAKGMLPPVKKPFFSEVKRLPERIVR